MIPWSRAERSEDAGDERAERELFARRARALPAARVPDLGEVMRRAAERDAGMPRARVAVGVVLAAACFAAVVLGHRGVGSRVEHRAIADDADAGAELSGNGAAMASWDRGADDEACCTNVVPDHPSQETLACFSPSPVVTPEPVRPASVACEGEDTCSLAAP